MSQSFHYNKTPRIVTRITIKRFLCQCWIVFKEKLGYVVLINQKYVLLELSKGYQIKKSFSVCSNSCSVFLEAGTRVKTTLLPQ